MTEQRAGDDDRDHPWHRAAGRQEPARASEDPEAARPRRPRRPLVRLPPARDLWPVLAGVLLALAVAAIRHAFTG